jgi:hypothetical protein
MITRRSRNESYREGPTLGRRILLQRSAITGFRHHQAGDLWAALRTDALLTLKREVDNPWDPDAVALHWRDRKLGYLPRGENLVVARLLDRERNLSARITALHPGAGPNERIRVEVLLH